MTHEAALALVQQIVDECSDREGELVHVHRGVELVTQALRAARREVWEEAAQCCERAGSPGEPIRKVVATQLAEVLRTQAEKEAP